MNRRNFLKSSALTAAATVIAKTVVGQSATSSDSASPGHVGKMTTAEFAAANQQGAAAVKSVTPTPAALSKADAALMMAVAEGGMMQLELSRVAASKATAPDVRALANAEVQEQTVLKLKLKEIAATKNLTMLDAPDAKLEAMIASLRALPSGLDFDTTYVRQSGVEGHQLLDATLKQVEAKAEDASLKALALAAHPLVLTHLKVAQEETAELAASAAKAS